MQLNRKQIDLVLKGISRLFWAVMLVGHLPALFAVQGRLLDNPWEAVLLAKYAFLLLSVVYFLLKLAGVRFWKVDPSFDRMLVYCLIILLLHSGVLVEYNLLPGMDSSLAAVFFGPVILALWGGTLLLLFGMVPVAGKRILDPYPDIRLLARAREPVVSPRIQQDHSHTQSHRGPPASIPHGKE
ncbi:MAG: hypothetical protein IT394_04980 [Candidatus Omnitrophica bacterium]|nr:MAG: hypothetical protein UZ16_OP3001000082 [Candidatus Hinthialibacteria bacterium OLB16]MBE7487320.1 hypothetical protein [bacterium]MBK7494002.1 hypothetical protein [Candidatus Omnitrophota bacterium]MCE7907009.1 hypothetical protein [Candidatus Omnitrophica bacterium COP1]MCC6732562.1 hypothetical protein [Candidatus Omnitrophota bacterium]